MIEARFHSLDKWPHDATPSHQRRHRFRAKWGDTLDLLESESNRHQNAKLTPKPRRTRVNISVACGVILHPWSHGSIAALAVQNS